MIDNKQIAGALRLAATYLGSGLHDNAVKSLERQAAAIEKATNLPALQPGEVAVKIEPVEDWPGDAAYVWAVYVNSNLNECGDLEAIISREDAERLEVE